MDRYKQYMGMENNSPESTVGNQLITPASTNLPDIEDLNIDNTINDNEAYYEYEVDLRPGQLEVGRGILSIRPRYRWKAGDGNLVPVPDSGAGVY